MVEYIQSQEPTQQSLDSMLDCAHAFRVIEGGVSRGQPLGTNVLIEGHDEKMLTDLREFLQIAGPTGSCFCHGDLGIEFLDESGNRLGRSAYNTDMPSDGARGHAMPPL
jgi:hypothetical protein